MGASILGSFFRHESYAFATVREGKRVIVKGDRDGNKPRVGMCRRAKDAVIVIEKGEEQREVVKGYLPFYSARLKKGENHSPEVPCLQRDSPIKPCIMVLPKKRFRTHGFSRVATLLPGAIRREDPTQKVRRKRLLRKDGR